MYNENMKIDNKIITYKSLNDLFQKMSDLFYSLKNIYNSEVENNKVKDSSNQVWSFKDNNSSLKFDVTYYDNSMVTYNDYKEFSTLFYSKLKEIRSIIVYFHLNYDTALNGNIAHHTEVIDLKIYEDVLDINVKLENNNGKLNNIYNEIENILRYSQDKYDDIIKNRKIIKPIICITNGFIPSFIISIILVLLPITKGIFSVLPILFPVVFILIAYFIGKKIKYKDTVALYDNITIYKSKQELIKNVPLYKDDVNRYLKDSEVLIGKNYNNVNYRGNIDIEYDKCKKYIIYEAFALLVLFIIVLIVL